eukprot:PRCOL_00001651-RA
MMRHGLASVARRMSARGLRTAPAAAAGSPAVDPAAALSTPAVDPLQSMLVESLKARRNFIDASVEALKLDDGVMAKADAWAKKKIELEKKFGIPDKFAEMEMAFTMAKARAGSMRELLALARDTMVVTLRYKNYDKVHSELTAALDRIERETGAEATPEGKEAAAASAAWADFFEAKMSEPENAGFLGLSKDAQLVEWYKTQLQILVDDVNRKIDAREDKLRKQVMKTLLAGGESFVPDGESPLKVQA